MDKQIFKNIVNNHKRKNNLLKDTFLSFIGGGLLGLISEGLVNLYFNIISVTLFRSV